MAKWIKIATILKPAGVFFHGPLGHEATAGIAVKLIYLLSLILFCDGWLQTAGSTVMLPSSLTNLCMHLAKPRQVTDQR